MALSLYYSCDCSHYVLPDKILVIMEASVLFISLVISPIWRVVCLLCRAGQDVGVHQVQST